MKFSDSGPYLVGFPAMQIMNVWGMLFVCLFVARVPRTVEMV